MDLAKFLVFLLISFPLSFLLHFMNNFISITARVTDLVDKKYVIISSAT